LWIVLDPDPSSQVTVVPDPEFPDPGPTSYVISDPDSDPDRLKVLDQSWLNVIPVNTK